MANLRLTMKNTWRNQCRRESLICNIGSKETSETSKTMSLCFLTWRSSPKRMIYPRTSSFSRTFANISRVSQIRRSNFITRIRPSLSSRRIRRLISLTSKTSSAPRICLNLQMSTSLQTHAPSSLIESSILNVNFAMTYREPSRMAKLSSYKSSTKRSNSRRALKRLSLGILCRRQTSKSIDKSPSRKNRVTCWPSRTAEMLRN